LGRCPQHENSFPLFFELETGRPGRSVAPSPNPLPLRERA
jgi:hypothetical protein